MQWIDKIKWNELFIYLKVALNLGFQVIKNLDVTCVLTKKILKIDSANWCIQNLSLLCVIWWSDTREEHYSLILKFQTTDDPDKPERRVHSDRHSSSKMEGEKKGMWILAGKFDGVCLRSNLRQVWLSEISVSENGYNLRMYVCWIWWLTKYIFWKFVRPLGCFKILYDLLDRNTNPTHTYSTES